MRLVSFDGGFGRVDGDSIVPMGSDLVGFLEDGRADEGEPFPLDMSVLKAPVGSPQKVVCIGLNYKDHAAETGGEVPEKPVLFPKWANSIAGPNDTILVPAAAKKVDYEAELAVVIGRNTRGVFVDDALDYVAGYMCANDVSARDLQFEGPQWTRGKAIDTFLPTGPWLVTPDEIGDPQSLGIRTIIGGEALQDSSTSLMAFSVAELISFISETMTLVPGDIIATGTPAGVGFVREPSRYLADGEEVTIEIDRIGSITNRVRFTA
ncbi:MAG TPA: fumarylacetoacetate hydrolase family protein [Actinomycetota bacterium]|nr:fumarylacetoacetate hydrolase family protein [Actinomycetota bacterium]